MRNAPAFFPSLRTAIIGACALTFAACSHQAQTRERRAPSAAEAETMTDAQLSGKEVTTIEVGSPNGATDMIIPGQEREVRELKQANAEAAAAAAETAASGPPPLTEEYELEPDVLRTGPSGEDPIATALLRPNAGSLAEGAATFVSEPSSVHMVVTIRLATRGSYHVAVTNEARTCRELGPSLADDGERLIPIGRIEIGAEGVGTLETYIRANAMRGGLRALDNTSIVIYEGDHDGQAPIACGRVLLEESAPPVG